jgi:hypothetical protein
MDRVETIGCAFCGKAILTTKIFTSAADETVCELCYRVERAKNEIKADVAADRIPASEVRGFSDLHDYVDANEYGGLCDDMPVDSETKLEAFMAMAEMVQGEVDEWILSGEMCADILKDRGHDVPTV